MKKYINLAAVVLSVIGGVLLLPAAAEVRKPEVEVITMKEYPYTETLTVNGTVEELRKKEVILRYPVVPDQILVEVGDTVSYGDVIATVDTEATKRAVLSYAAEYADALPGGLFPDGLQTVLAAVDADELFETLELPAKILSPASGTLTSLSLTEGELFLPQSAAAAVSVLHPLQLRLAVSENDIGRILPGQHILFTTSAVEGGAFAATVKRIFPTAYQKLSGLAYETVVDVTATVADDFDVLRPGYSVRAKIACGEEETLRLLPYEAILQDAAGTEYVYVYKDGSVQRRDIKTGVELSTSVAVTYGLSPYEQVVLNASSVKEDGPVRLKSSR